MEILAWSILGVIYIFGGAAVFDNHHTKFKDVLVGWLLLNLVAVLIYAVFFVAFWALAVVTT